MSILFSDIYTKAIALFDDPKITVAYNTRKIQFYKIMYTYLQNAISMFNNPSSIGVRLSNYKEPIGNLEVFQADGKNQSFKLDDDFQLLSNSIFNFIENQNQVKGNFIDARTIQFPDLLPENQEYAFEAYYCGEFLDDFDGLSKSNTGNNLIIGQIKDILARLLVKAWAEEERNLLLDIRNLMQDSDFKIHSNATILNAKDKWINQLDSEILQMQNKLAWNIRFMSGSSKIGRG